VDRLFKQKLSNQLPATAIHSLKALAIGERYIMKSSSDRTLTTHTGSLPRSKAFSAMLVKREQRKPYDASALQVFRTVPGFGHQGQCRVRTAHRLDLRSSGSGRCGRQLPSHLI
jgi:hypothetical protein